MKKLFALIMTAGAVLALRADEAAVRKVFAEVNRLGAEWKLQEALKYYTPDFEETSADGKKVDMVLARKAARMLEIMNRGDLSLTEMIVAAKNAAGEPVSEADIRMYQDLEKTEHGAKTAKLIRETWTAQKTKMQQTIQAQVESFVITDVKVDGDRAVAVFRQKNIENGKMEEHRCELVKKDGNWLIRRDIGKYVEAK
ncbi:MAG: hypothetical protein MR051_05650 [Lentisphaeria bacterium]|nr:hypothetical protein [Lentisphaeria bacterium]